ncbi:MAG: xanthine dehydrogenase family protein subunit M [Gammaproteobacteria bacterium]|nr:xanthine dehydrogenase family protein subunit M [Gammaproteobacteria bacterium]
MMIENYKVPSSISEAAQLLHQGEATIVAGGTDLTPQTEAGVRQFAATLINIQRIEEMRGISLANGSYRIGGLTTVTEILESETLAADVPVLVEAADHFASPQIRNASSLAGNLCNASPAGDMCIPLLLLDAKLELVSWANDSVFIRTVALSDFFIGPGKTVLQAGELLTAIEFNKPCAGFTATFQKSGPRPALEISIVSMGVAGVLKDGVLTGARVAIGAVAPIPLRATATEAVLEDQTLSEDIIKKAVEAVQQEVTPIDDVRASAWYRKHLTGVYIRRALSHVAGN